MPNRCHASFFPGVIEKAINSMDKNDYSAAMNQIDMAIASDPSNLQYRSVKVNLLVEMKNYHGALKELQAMETMDPNLSVIYCLESQCLLNLGRNDEAIQAADKSLKYDHSYFPAYSNKATALMNMGFLSDAIETYYEAIKLNPEDADSHAYLADLHLKMGNFASAGEEANLAIKMQSDNITANNVLISIAKSTGNVESYIKSLSNAYLNTFDEEYILQLTNCLYVSGRIVDAKKIAERFYKMYPNNIGFLDNLARIYLLENRFDRSEKIYNYFLLANNNLYANLRYITFLNEAEKYSEVLKKVDKLIKKYPDSEGFVYNKFYALSLTGDHKNAILIIKGLYTQNPHSIFYAIEYAIEMIFLGNYTESLRVLNSLEGKNNIPELFIALWTVYLLMNEPEASTKYAIEAIKNMVDDDFLAEFPEQVIDSYLDIGWVSESLDFIDKIIEMTEGELRDICIACKACLLGTDNYGEGHKALQGIGDNAKIRHILYNILKFNNPAVKNFIKMYMNEKN